MITHLRPISEEEILIREVAKDVWSFTAPFDMWDRVPIGGRSIAIKLSDGKLWVLASTPLSDGTRKKLAELGEVKYLIAANLVHHLFLKEWRAAYPDATLIGPEGLNAKKAHEGLQLDKVVSEKNPNVKFGFEDEIEWICFFGYTWKDLAFYHYATKTAIAPDLLINLPSYESYALSKIPARWFPLANGLSPFSWVIKAFFWFIVSDKEQMRRDVRKVTSWDFVRFIPCHGNIVEEGAKEAWNEAFRLYL